MDTDCFQVSVKDFLEYKENIVPNPKLKNILDEKVFICSCFNDTPPPPVYQRTHVKDKHWSNKSNNQFYKKQIHTRYPNQPINTVRKKIGNDDNISRTTVALLNKLSSSNFEKIKNKIFECLEYDDYNVSESFKINANVLAQNIIKKCYTDINYIQMYINLMKALPMCSDTFKQNALDLLKDFIYCLPFNVNLIKKNITVEKNLNRYIKLKNELYNKNKCLSHFIFQGYIETDACKYIQHLKDIFDKMIELDPIIFIEIYDILINFMYDFCYVNNKSEIKTFIINIVKNIRDGNTIECQRTKFKLDDLHELTTN